MPKFRFVDAMCFVILCVCAAPLHAGEGDFVWLLSCSLLGESLSQTAFKTYESQYYILETDLPEARAKWIGQVMDGIGKEYSRRFAGFRGLVIKKPRLKVFATKQQYDDEVVALASDKLKFTGGAFIHGVETVYSFESEELEHVLKHECFHQFAFYVVKGVLPLWVNEGLAEYFADGAFDEKAKLLKLGTVPLYRALSLEAAVKDHSLMTIDQLLRIDGNAWAHNFGSRTGPVQYHQAWALCHFLIHGDGGKYERYFNDFLHHIDEGLDGRTAYNRAFGEDTKPLQAKYDEYVRELVVHAKAKAANP